MPQQVAANYSTSAAPQGVADRVDQLNQTGHSWMPADMQTSLATSSTSDSEMQSIADGIKNTLSSSWHGFTEAFHDPVLDKQDSTGLALTRFLTSAVGPLPVAQTDLSVIQRNLQKTGFGKDLPTDGVWGSDWNVAYNAWATALRNDQLAGNRPGSVGTAKAGGSIWDSLNPVHAVNAVGGFIESIPGDVRSLAADSVGNFGSLVSDVGHGDVGGIAKRLAYDIIPGGAGVQIARGDVNAQGARYGAAVESVGGKKVTPEEYQRRLGFGRALQDLQTVLLFVPVAGEGSAAARVVAGEFAKGITREAAQRGPGVIAKTFFGGLAKGQVERRGLLNTRVFQNVPLLGQVGPVVGKLADHDGLYYQARTLLARPYQYPGVRAAGALGQRYLLTGAALHGTATAENALGLGSPMTHQIVSARPLDVIDLSLHRITGTPFEHPFSDAIDGLGFLLHGPLGSRAAVTKVGDHVQTANDAYSDVLGRVGVQGIWERAVTKATGTKTSTADLEKAFGGPEYLDRFQQMKLADLAAAHYAQKTAQDEGLTFGSPNYRDRVGQLADDVWKNPDLHVEAIKQLLAHDAGVGLENRVAADMIHNNLDPKLYEDGLLDHTENPTVDGYVRNAKAWMQAGDHLTSLLRDGHGKYLFGPDGKTVIADAQDNFDFGYGQDNPVRTLPATRRVYVHQVTTTLDRVRRQINDTRTSVGKMIADAEQSQASAQAAVDSAEDRDAALNALRSATGTLNHLRGVQAKLEAAVTDGDMQAFTTNAKQAFPVSRKTRGQWDRLIKDTTRLRALVDQTSETSEGRLSLGHLLEHGVNPDELYTNVNGEPRPFDEPVGSGDWLRQHLATDQGAVGLGKVTTKSAQEAAKDVAGFDRALQAAKTPEDKTAVVEAMKNYGFREFGMTERTLGVHDGNPQRLVDLLDEHAHKLASEVFLTYDTPQHVREKIQAIRQLGFRPMIGSHIGHMWDGSLPPLPDLHGAVTLRRKIASTMGLAPEQISSRTAGQDASLRVLREIHTALQSPDATIPARTTAETIMQVLRDRNLVQPDMKGLETLAFDVTTKLHRRGIEQLQQERGLDSYDDAKQAYQSEMARALQLRDIPRSKFIKALTTPGEGETAGGGRWMWGGMDERTANLVRRAVIRGYADRPGYIMGLSSLEDWARGGFWFLDKLATSMPTSELAQRVAELPNAVVNARNRLRFTLSPFFDFRRVAKQNYKMGLDGVTPVFNPLKHLVDQDTFKAAHKFLNKLVGDPQVEGFDDADRYLHQQSVWGLYNSRHFEAYYAWEKKAAGATDDEIREGIRRVFDYGSARQGGRSALERSVNTVFFPFSFEKTLLRNTGAYMLSHPQQAMLLTAAMSAYNDANQHGEVTQWVADHLPILHDMQKLNAFAHGISPGQLGGINAPLLNLFLPQTWGSNLTVKNLKKNLPIWNDFGRLISDIREQGTIGKNAALNTIDYATHLGAPRAMFDPYRPTVTGSAQTRLAGQMRAQFITALAPVLQTNAGRETGKIVWPDAPLIPAAVRGQNIDRTTIGKLIQTWYPAYDPSAGATYAIQQKNALATEIAKIRVTDPARAGEYQAFANVADKIAGHLTRGDYDTPEAAGLMMTLRTIAVGLAEHDPAFLKFFTTHFKYSFGPLTEVK